jgi:hypothetical protein
LVAVELATAGDIWHAVISSRERSLPLDIPPIFEHKLRFDSGL